MKKALKTKLRIRFVVLTMSALFLLLGVIVSASIYNNYRDLVSKSDLILSQLRQSPSASVRYFSVNVHPGKGAVKPDIVQHVSITPEQAAAYAGSALASGQEQGFIDGYRYRIYRSDAGIRIFFLSREASIEMLQTASANLIGISLASLLVVCILLILLSGWVVEPMLKNHQKQKEFITSASHELKTPLTVISTNAQMLREKIGENLWLDGILQQTEHLTEMTCELVKLAKAEETEAISPKTCFFLDAVCNQMLESYRAVAEQKGITVSASLPQGLQYTGPEKEIRQLLGILLDNAFRYCPAGGQIRLSVQKDRRKVHITLVNTSSPVGNGCITERFCRGENAANTPGFGLGLSIARTIAEQVGGKLTVTAEQAAFTAKLTLR